MTNLIARREYNSQGRVVKTSTAGSNTTRTLHAQGQVFSQKDPSANWEWMLADGLGSVRGVVSSAAGVLEHRHFDPFGNLFAGTMSQTDYGFTGEPFDSATGLLYLRARHYRPANGTFVSRDPFEGTMSRPMSRNGYSWVEGRVADGRDPSGMIGERPEHFAICTSQSQSSQLDCGLNAFRTGEFNFSVCEQSVSSCRSRIIGPDVFGVIRSSARAECASAGRSNADSAINSAEGCTVEILAYNTSAALNHTFLVFTDNTGNEYAYSAGPENLAGARGLIAQARGEVNVFGKLKVYTGAFSPGFIDYDEYFAQGGGPRIVLNVTRQSSFQGLHIRSCGLTKGCLDQESERISRLGINYEVLGPNSNTFTSRLLQFCGLPLVIPFGQNDLVIDAPGWGSSGLDQ